MKKIVFMIVFLLLLFPNTIEAKSLNDYYNELAKLQKEYNENKNNKQLTQSQMNQLNSDISKINSTIESIRKDIKTAEKDIEDSKNKIDDKRVETDGLIQFLQVSNGGNIYLEYLFDAENYTEFIYRYEIVKQLTNYNSELIMELEDLIVDLQEKEEELSNKKVKLEKERNVLTSKLSKLQTSLKTYNVEGTTIEDDIKDLKKQIKAYEDKGCSRYQDVSTCTASINAKGWSFPLAKGCVTSEYTGSAHRTDWSGGGSHWGIDLSCVTEGTNVYPAADGVVVRMVYKYSCGGNMLYINHVVNGKRFTTAYMHLLGFGRDIYVGKVVTTKTVIGSVGGYSTATNRGGYDQCTSGAHLHFGISEGHSAFNFNSYAFNPREILGFPKLIYSGGGYFYR